ncbi:MAG: acyl-CoA dehydrogenase family protein [Thermogemmatispora sp.]|jgi:alkylation response protein AidB-like acyl-CoA dehydrogenase|uniref:acyl-CoA dehydrogenase family protein n=1 Tax=Thermogemmatispora sp. TaxID=1968838 RepID=UPI0019E64945|nr:acyl-CoA dehydrogenase family protein [Thermogemmatispora sp.]MBE3565567.1 acyl-CoA dehydrogenase family protein [Thermogemmatispora sp.]
MNFYLTEEQQLIRDTARRIAREVVAPRAPELDDTGIYPEDIFQVYKETGLLGLGFPEELGGSGAGIFGLALAIEEIAKVDNACALILLLTRLSTSAILKAGTEEQKRKYCAGTARGELRGAFGLTEPGAGSDSANIATRAVRKGDEYILTGTKCYISGASVADFFLVAAKTDPGAGSRGFSVFIVDRDTPGFRVGREDRKMGVHGVPTCELIFEEARVPAHNLVGRENEGFKLIMWNLNSVRPCVAARGVGTAEGAIQYAVDYARQRQTFGQPLIEHQAIQMMIAEVAMHIEASRLLTYQAALLVDEGKADREHAHFLSMAKAFATETAVEACDKALQIMGGLGYMHESLTERFYRDARQLTIVEGTSQVQRLIIARAVKDNLLNWY